MKSQQIRFQATSFSWKWIEQHLKDGHLWPEPLPAFNLTFATVGPVGVLANAGVLAPQVADAFRGGELFGYQLEPKMMLELFLTPGSHPPPQRAAARITKRLTPCPRNSL